MNRLARFSVNYPTTIIMIVLGIILLGYISFTRLGIDLFPDLNSPRLFVEIKAGERPPEEMEKQFVSNMEAIAARGRKVENVSSVSRVGQALITVEYNWQADMDEAFLDLQKAVADFSQANDADEINVSQHDPNAVPVVVAILSHPEIDDIDLLRRTAENIIRNELIRLPGVAAVEIIGAQEREIEVITDSYRLEAYDLTLNQLTAAIRQSNRNMTGGSIVEMGRRYVIRGIGELTTEEELNDLIVTYKTESTSTLPGATGQSRRVPVYLREVAQVGRGLTEPENIVRFNGNRCLALEIYKEARFNTIEAAARAREQLAILEKSLPGYNLRVIQDQARFINSAITEVGQTGLVGIILAVIVLYVFLRRARTTAVISVAIPISIIATFNLMYFNELTLNIMTLGGLALGAGMLVDNAIVVVENIFRHIENGKPASEAAILGTGEVGGAITSSTATTIIVFLPIVYLHGAAAELFRDQAWTVAYSLLSSLFVALAVIPMLCSKLLKQRSTPKPVKTISFARYRRFLIASLARSKTIVLSGLTLLAITALLIPFIGSEFMPSADQGEIFINLTLPEGTGLDRTTGTVRNLEATITEKYGASIDHIYSRIGPGNRSSDLNENLIDENNAVLHIVLKSDMIGSLEPLIAGIDEQLSQLPEIESQLTVQQTALQSTLGTTSAPLAVEIRGYDLDILNRLADEVKEKISVIPELINIESGYQGGRPEININIDRTMAAQFSLDASSIGSQLQTLLSGDMAGQMRYQGDYIDINVRRPELALSELSGLLIDAPSGRKVRLDEIARLVPAVSLREITRNNQIRVANVSAHVLDEIPFDKVVARVRQALSIIELPPEYSLAVTGEEELRQEAFGNLKFALLLAIILVYMVMASQFESLRHPFVILLTIPLAGVGAVIMLFILNMPFNIMSFIGIIMLTGIAVNDSIILVDRINRNRRSGMELIEAILNAGQTRIRPIIMTSVTTILALLPLTIGIGEGASLRAPMAVAVIGGLFSSTALTLIVIPSVYYLMAGKISAINTGSE